MRKRKFLLSLLLGFVLLMLASPAALASSGCISFCAGDPDANGNFRMTVTVSNAAFNVCGFALRYDPATVIPTDSAGAATDNFGKFAKTEVDWLNGIGNSIDTEKGLIIYSGYITPGSSPTSDGAEKISGVADLGKNGAVVLTLHFRQLTSNPITLTRACKEKGAPYDEFMPKGVALLNGGEEMDCTWTMTLPALLGVNSIEDIPAEKADTDPNTDVTNPGTVSDTSDGNSDGTISGTPAAPDTDDLTLAQRARDVILLQINNYAAIVDGVLTHIYPGETSVVPYLDAAEGRTYVPARFVAEKMGAVVDWEAATKTVVITANGKVIRMQVGSNTYTVDGVEKKMDAAARFLESTPGYVRTVVPIRFVAEALGRDVTWDSANRLVRIAPAALPWREGRAAEQELTEKSLILLGTMFRDIVTQ